MPVLFGALIAFGVYRRVRRNIGRQPLSPARLTSRIALFSFIGGMILLMSFRDMNLFGAMLAGIAAGAGLGWFGLKHTQFEATAQGQFYTPHTYIGAFVSALFLGASLIDSSCCIRHRTRWRPLTRILSPPTRRVR
jgi:hypothetical protein